MTLWFAVSVLFQVWLGGVIWGLIDNWRDTGPCCDAGKDNWVRRQLPDWLEEWWNGGNSLWECLWVARGKDFYSTPWFLRYKPGGWVRWIWCSDYFHGLKNLYIANSLVLVVRLLVEAFGPWFWLSLPALFFVEGRLGFTPVYHWLERQFLTSRFKL